MEEAWNNISPPPLHSPQTRNRNPATHHGFIFQDFLNPSSPTGKDPPTRRMAMASPPPGSDQLPRRLPYFPPSLNFSPFDQATMDSTSSPLLNSFSLKHSLEENDRPVAVGDRRYNRRMKNRESAARSRNRRMAYTSELERKRLFLIKDNARLRRELQQQQLLSSAAAAATTEEAPKKHNLTRSLSALF